MFISIKDLQAEDVSFDEQLKPGTLDLGPETTQEAPLKAKGKASLVEEHEGHTRIADIRLVGDFSTRVEMKCARCLEPVVRNVAAHFDLIYRPLGAVPRPAESAISEAETEIGFYQGSGLELEQALTEQVLLAVPLRELCKPDCKGLCAHCGKNLNADECHCQAAAPDSRWAALAEVKNKLKN
jgi:DUF177 domain-containing protein